MRTAHGIEACPLHQYHRVRPHGLIELPHLLDTHKKTVSMLDTSSHGANMRVHATFQGSTKSWTAHPLMKRSQLVQHETHTPPHRVQEDINQQRLTDRLKDYQSCSASCNSGIAHSRKYTTDAFLQPWGGQAVHVKFSAISLRCMSETKIFLPSSSVCLRTLNSPGPVEPLWGALASLSS